MTWRSRTCRARVVCSGRAVGRRMISSAKRIGASGFLSSCARMPRNSSLRLSTRRSVSASMRSASACRASVTSSMASSSERRPIGPDDRLRVQHERASPGPGVSARSRGRRSAACPSTRPRATRADRRSAQMPWLVSQSMLAFDLLRASRRAARRTRRSPGRRGSPRRARPAARARSARSPARSRALRAIRGCA